MPKSKNFNFYSSEKTDYVVVLGGGFSTGIYKKNIQNYINNHSALTIAANYNYGIKSYYTYFTDMRKFHEQINSISPESHIILRRWAYENDKLNIDKTLSLVRDNFYLVGLGKNSNRSIYKSSSSSIIDEDGNISYSTLGICGIGCILLASLCKPKEILITGIDGPDMSYCTKKMFNGMVVDAHVHKVKKIKSYLTYSLFPYLKNSNIKISTFSGVEFYGINKEDLHISVINE